MTSLLGRSLAAMSAGAPGMVDIETFALLVGISKSQAEKCARSTTAGTYPHLHLKKAGNRRYVTFDEIRRWINELENA